MIEPWFEDVVDKIVDLINSDPEQALEKISNLIIMINTFYPLGDISEQNDVRFSMMDIATGLRNQARLKHGLMKSRNSMPFRKKFTSP